MKATTSKSAHSLNIRQPTTAGLISRRKLAAIMGVSTETIKRAERRGELHPLKFNARLVRYNVEDIARWFCASSAACGGHKLEEAAALLQARAASRPDEAPSPQPK